MCIINTRELYVQVCWQSLEILFANCSINISLVSVGGTVEAINNTSIWVLLTLFRIMYRQNFKNIIKWWNVYVRKVWSLRVFSEIILTNTFLKESGHSFPFKHVSVSFVIQLVLVTVSQANSDNTSQTSFYLLSK